jgi:hypothetical protein
MAPSLSLAIPSDGHRPKGETIMLIKARIAIMAVALVVPTQTIAVWETDLSSCCLLPGTAKGQAPHVQNMRWETHGTAPVATGEWHEIDPTWLSVE